MERRYSKKAGTRKRLVIFIFLLFCFHVWAQEFTCRIIIEKTSFAVNEEFKFTILIPEISPAKLIMEEPKFPDGLEVVAGPSKRPGRNGSIVDYTFRVNRTGRYLIESFAIKSSAKTMHTTPVFITGFPLTSAFDKVPPSVRWDIPKDTYYPGEIIPLRFAVENIENPGLIIESQVSQKSDGYVKKISGSPGKGERTVVAKKIMTGEIYDVLFHDHIFVPFKSGSITLPDAEIYLSAVSAGAHSAGGDYLTILKGTPVMISAIPESAENTGALGNYSYKYEISDNKISDLQAVILKQKITGIGNFYGITMPAPSISNPALADISLIKDRYDVTPEGKLFKGSRELVYSISKKTDGKGMSNKERHPENQENISVVIPDFSWYSKNSFESLSGSKLERIPGAVLVLKPEENLSGQSVSDIKPADKEKKINKIALEIFKIILIISVVPALFFVLKKKIKKTIIALLITVLLCVIIVFFIITKIFAEQPVYGIVIDSQAAANTYVIPEESGAVKFSVEKGETVRIIGEKDKFYLIETNAKSGRGWMKKENIILE